MVIIFLFFGYSKWFNYEAQALIPLNLNSEVEGGFIGIH
jgi:uncharacterized membrane protein YkgB